MIYVIYRSQLNNRILVTEVVELLSSHKECNDHLALVDTLLAAVYSSLFIEIYHSVSDHFRMYAQVLLFSQLCQYRVRNSADTQLQRSSVVDQRRAVLTDSFFHLSDLGRSALEQRVRILNESVDLAYMYESFAENCRNLIVYFSDHCSG